MVYIFIGNFFFQCKSELSYLLNIVIIFTLRLGSTQLTTAIYNYCDKLFPSTGDKKFVTGNVPKRSALKIYRKNNE